MQRVIFILYSTGAEKITEHLGSTCTHTNAHQHTYTYTHLHTFLNGHFLHILHHTHTYTHIHTHTQDKHFFRDRGFAVLTQKKNRDIELIEGHTKNIFFLYIIYPIGAYIIIYNAVHLIRVCIIFFLILYNYIIEGRSKKEYIMIWRLNIFLFL